MLNPNLQACEQSEFLEALDTPNPPRFKVLRTLEGGLKTDLQKLTGQVGKLRTLSLLQVNVGVDIVVMKAIHQI